MRFVSQGQGSFITLTVLLINVFYLQSRTTNIDLTEFTVADLILGKRLTMVIIVSFSAYWWKITLFHKQHRH